MKEKSKDHSLTDEEDRIYVIPSYHLDRILQRLTSLKCTIDRVINSTESGVHSEITPTLEEIDSVLKDCLQAFGDDPELVSALQSAIKETKALCGRWSAYRTNITVIPMCFSLHRIVIVFAIRALYTKINQNIITVKD